MERRYNRNESKTTDSRYVRQQQVIREVCKELNLVAYYPNYHADKTDKNTVIIYTKEGHEYNETLPSSASTDDEKGRVCSFQNTDINGMFDLDYMNHGNIKIRYGEEKELIGNYIKKCLANLKR